MFFFKPKEIHIDCFTDRSDVYDFFPIDYSHKFFPEWWKKLPKKMAPFGEEGWKKSTIKQCIGFNLYYKNSLTIPLWTDMYIDSKKKELYEVSYSDKVTNGSTHDIDQMEGFINPKEFALHKIHSPWHFICKEDIDWTWTQPIWNFTTIDEIIIPPGVIDYKYQTSTNINLFFRMGKTILIECGQPMVNLRPLTEKKLKIHTHLIDKEEMNRIRSKNSKISFSGKYNKIKQIIKKKESESKCPFHF
jgi:hypothetical protein